MEKLASAETRMDVQLFMYKDFIHTSHSLALYNSNNIANSCVSDSPLPQYKLIHVRKDVNSSYNPSNLPELSAIIAPIFSNVASCRSHDGSSSIRHVVNLSLCY